MDKETAHYCQQVFLQLAPQVRGWLGLKMQLVRSHSICGDGKLRRRWAARTHYLFGL